MAEITSLNIADANNTARFNGANNVSTLDDAGRLLEGIIARNYRDNDGTNTTTGTGAAYVITLNRTGLSLNADVRSVLVRAHLANTGACTIAINSLTAKPIKKRGNTDIIIGDILINDLVWLVYNPAWDAYQLMGI